MMPDDQIPSFARNGDCAQGIHVLRTRVGIRWQTTQPILDSTVKPWYTGKCALFGFGIRDVQNALQA